MTYLLPCCEQVGNCPVWSKNGFTDILDWSIDVLHLLAMQWCYIGMFEWCCFILDGAYFFTCLVEMVLHAFVSVSVGVVLCNVLFG